MSESCKQTFTVFSGMFSLIFKYSEDKSSLRLPNIFLDEDSEVEQNNSKENIKQNPKKSSAKPAKKRISACPHINKRHYAKNMCSNCYHRSGRQKKAWTCPHQDRQLYAKGMCQFCYLRSYHKSRSIKAIKTENLKFKI